MVMNNYNISYVDAYEIEQTEICNMGLHGWNGNLNVSEDTKIAAVQKYPRAIERVIMAAAKRYAQTCSDRPYCPTIVRHLF
jgi:hypothetical protein